MTRCRKCDEFFSSNLDHCPACGQRSRSAKTTLWLRILSLIVFGVAVTIVFLAIRKMGLTESTQMELATKSLASQPAKDLAVRRAATATTQRHSPDGRGLR